MARLLGSAFAQPRLTVRTASRAVNATRERMRYGRWPPTEITSPVRYSDSLLQR